MDDAASVAVLDRSNHDIGLAVANPTTFTSVVYECQHAKQAISDSAAAAQKATLGLEAGPANKVRDLDQLPPELVEHPRYEIIKRIGRSGMGDVYLAQHRVMNRRVVLKVIKPALVQHEEAQQRFRREVQAAARQTPTAWLKVLDAGEFRQAAELVHSSTRIKAKSRASWKGRGRVFAFVFGHRFQ